MLNADSVHRLIDQGYKHQCGRFKIASEAVSIIPFIHTDQFVVALPSITLLDIL